MADEDQLKQTSGVESGSQGSPPAASRPEIPVGQQASAPNAPQAAVPAGEPPAVSASPDAGGATPQTAAAAPVEAAAQAATSSEAEARAPGQEPPAAVAGEGSGEPAPAGGLQAAPSDGGESEALDADGKPKRKRRRRRKKKDGTASGDVEAPEAQAARPAKKKEGSHAPFARFFMGAAVKRHAFAVGEVVAGRVTRADERTIAVDLFGKATAYVDQVEPREIPLTFVKPPPSPVEAAPAEAEAGSDVAAHAASEAGGAPAAQAEVPDDAQATGSAREGDTALSAEAVESSPTTEPSADAEMPVEAPASEAQPKAAAEPSEPAQAAQAAQSGHGDDAANGAAGQTTAVGAEAPRGPLETARLVPAELGIPEPASVGQIFKGRVGAVAESGHIAILNRIVNRGEARAQLERYREERRRVEGLVYGFNRGGFDVLVCGVRAFCPVSAMALEEIQEPDAYLGMKCDFLLPSGRSEGKDVVVSRRSILEREQRKKAKELLKTLKVGQTFAGKVTSVREFGLFVDIGGVEGLVHQSEVSYAHGTKPGDVAQAGDEVQVRVLRIGGDPPGKGRDGVKKDARRDRTTRVSLSMKALQADPWDEETERLAEGTIQLGKVTRTTEFGAFVELAPSVEGLLHITEIGRELKHANQALKEGEELHVIVERVDKKARRISLSKPSEGEVQDFKEGKTLDAKAPTVRTGAKITVKVERVEARGLVVRIDGAIGKRARGFIPDREMGTERGTDHRRRFPQGMELEVKVIGTDRDGGLRCSIKALAMDEERRAIKEYRKEASKQGFGTFGDLLKAKLGDGSTDSKSG